MLGDFQDLGGKLFPLLQERFTDDVKDCILGLKPSSEVHKEPRTGLDGLTVMHGNTDCVLWQCYASSHLCMGGEMKVHSLRRSLCLSTDTLPEVYTSTQSLLVELRLAAESRQSWLLPKPSTKGDRNSTCSDPLRKEEVERKKKEKNGTELIQPEYLILFLFV